MTRKSLAVLACSCAALGATAPAASATSCAPESPREQAARADVIVDAVALPGPTLGSTLLSPARFAALRYVKGRGPRLVDVGTGISPALLVENLGLVAGDFGPAPGEVWRIYSSGRGGSSSAARGLKNPGPCGGTRLIDSGRPMRTVARGFVQIGDEGIRWRGTAREDRRRLGCVRLSERRLETSAGSCTSLGRRRATAAVVSSGSGERASTGIAVAGRGIRRIEVERPDGVRRVGAESPRLVLTVLAGFVPEHALRVRVVFRDGSSTVLDDAVRRHAGAADPAGGRVWNAFAERLSGKNRHVVCARVSQDRSRFPASDELVNIAAACVGRAPFGFSVVDLGDRTVMTGVARSGVESVEVRGPGAPRTLSPARRGGAFLTVYPGEVGPGDLTVTFRLRDGTSKTYAGRSGANLVGPKRLERGDVLGSF